MENPSSSSSSAELERQLCIQREPKALFEKEMKLAREAALQVINNNSKEEALKIFLEGLEPVMTSVKPTWDDSLTSDSDEEY
ncbi:hypothetical protein QUC31_001109 [Theobroma cacao]|uniref:Uncharacterized protein n=1 Tax=Theobroma cacao TaxID=3641 RepID=A0A061FI44_THECC|nr:Uncharacterized protein TCM_035403 [Theobroma cacao]WRX31360.1 hypothetical protein QQP08_023847 [Theobroma cacao]